MERNLLINLVTRAQKGDSTAMDELFAAFYNDVYYFALKTLKDSDIACDITQETFLEIINTISNLNEPAAFVTWMKQITYHQCTRYFKKKKDVLVEEDEDGNTIFDALPDESEGSIPSEVYEKEEFRNTILGIINELTEEQRSAVMMYYFDELSVGQIAKIQGVSEGTVKSRLNYARKAIRKSVENYEKKHNIKLHSFSFLPLFLLFFGEDLMPTAKAAEIGAVVSETANTMATGTAVVGVGGISTVTSAEAAAATAGTGIATKIAALPIVTKILAGVVAATFVIGGGAAVISNLSGNNGEHLWVDCVDKNQDCSCDVCSAGIHFIQGERYGGKVAHDAVCDNCGADLGFYDENADNLCDVCGEYPCGTFHNAGHCDGDSDGICDNCGAAINDELSYSSEEEVSNKTEPTENEVLVAPSTPTISIASENGTVVLTIDAVDAADKYEIYINGICIAETSSLSYTIGAHDVNVGTNEVYVRAYNEAGYSDNSATVITGKLADPQYHATGTGVEFLWGDVENAEGYIIYGDDGEYLATIPLGGTFDFADIYTESGFYFPYIQAYADKWISSEKCGIPVTIGDNGGPIGYAD